MSSLGEYYCDFNGACWCLKLVYGRRKSVHAYRNYPLELSQIGMATMMPPEEATFQSMLTAIFKCTQVCLYWNALYQQPRKSTANLRSKLQKFKQLARAPEGSRGETSETRGWEWSSKEIWLLLNSILHLDFSTDQVCMDIIKMLEVSVRFYFIYFFIIYLFIFVSACF